MNKFHNIFVMMSRKLNQILAADNSIFHFDHCSDGIMNCELEIADPNGQTSCGR
jgi:hypothetical protein